MSSQDYSGLIVEMGDDHVTTITINRPESLNSFDIPMIEAFERLWADLKNNDDVRAVVLRAAPGRAFCTGMDVTGPSPVFSTPNLWNQADPGERLGPKGQRCWKPVIAAVHGMCAGGGLYMINEADIVICSEEATFFDPHVTYGMVAALEPIGLSHKIGLHEVLRMALLGNDERIGAETALRIGLVTEVTSLDALWARAHGLAATIAAKPPAAVQGTVRAIWESLDMSRTAALATALKYPQLGSPVGKAQVDRWAIMGDKKKRYDIR
jgi:enoyl-CoA hydratase/carnithine racemase